MPFRTLIHFEFHLSRQFACVDGSVEVLGEVSACRDSKFNPLFVSISKDLTSSTLPVELYRFSNSS